MSKLKSAIFDLTLSEKVVTGRDRITALTGNTELNPDPAKLTEFSNSVTALQNAIADVGSAQITLSEKYSRQLETEKEYNKQSMKMVNELNSLTSDEAKLLTSGFPISKSYPENSLADITAPGNLTALMSVKKGEIKIKWRSVRSAQAYILEYSTDSRFPAENTITAHLGKITKTVIAGLEPGSNIWLRVQAIKGNDKGPWSDPALTMVP